MSDICNTLKRIIKTKMYLAELRTAYDEYAKGSVNRDYNRGRADALDVAIRGIETALWGDEQ